MARREKVGIAVHKSAERNKRGFNQAIARSILEINSEADFELARQLESEGLL
jgi:hypothetical protein